MIVIGKPYIECHGNKDRLIASVHVDGRETSLWFEVDHEYGCFLCWERIDAFVLGLMHEAIRTGHDIVSEAPMTERLYRQLTEQFLPAYFKVNCRRLTNGRRGFLIKCPVAPEVEHPDSGNAVGTGVSCGVDSLHVFAKHKEITHGAVWNLHGVTANETEGTRERGWRNLVKNATSFVNDIGCKLIIGDTNYDRGCLPTVQHDGSTTYANLFCIFALQKLWREYYVASGYDIGDFTLIANNGTDPAHYEYLLFALCGLSKMAVYLDGVAQTRVEKVGDLIEYAPAQKHLNVCFGIQEDGGNCTMRCAKCMRTLLNLEAFNAVDKFKNVFDVAYYRSHYYQYIAEYWRGCLQGNPFALEMRPYFKNRKIGLGTRLKAVRIVVKKGLMKVFRLGRERHGEFLPE